MPNLRAVVAIIAALTLAGCATHSDASGAPGKAQAFSEAAQYTIGPGDQLSIFVWRNPELSVNVPVRPDGRISIPLVQDVQAAGKTSVQLGIDIKTALTHFVKDPVVTVIVQGVQSAGDDRITIVGDGMPPRSVAYRAGVTVLDVMVEIGGLKEFSAGNRARLLRRGETGVVEIPLHLNDLLVDGDQSANVLLLPGDVIRIPERWL